MNVHEEFPKKKSALSEFCFTRLFDYTIVILEHEENIQKKNLYISVNQPIKQLNFEQKYFIEKRIFLPNGKKWKSFLFVYSVMESLINYLLQFGILDGAQIEYLKSQAVIRRCKKDERNMLLGQAQNEVAFLIKGILRIYYLNSKGEEVTKFFFEENSILVDIHSYIHDQPATACAHVLAECEFIVFSEQSMKDILAQIPGWELLYSKITAAALAKKVNVLSAMVCEDAKTRYLSFLRDHPMLANRIPLHYLASYLGVTATSLSRIRRNIIHQPKIILKESA